MIKLIKKRLSEAMSAVSDKTKEAAASVLPLVALITVICFSVAPIAPDIMLNFFIGTVFVIAGIGFFSLGAENSMTPIGSRTGAAMTKTASLPTVLIISFLLGFAVTVSEPDLQVLAKTVPHIDSVLLLVTVGIGVGFFLSVCMLRIITGIRLRKLLILFYGIIFCLAAFTDADFLGIAFDSGGVTTGPMTVPFILALGVGVANIRSDSNAEADSFGLVALCSVGPILAVLLLGFFCPGSGDVSGNEIISFVSTIDIGEAYISSLPEYMGEMLLSLSPIAVIFFVFQIFSFKLSKRRLMKICVGLLYTYIGLVLFLTGVNVGFSFLGKMLGEKLASEGVKFQLIPLSMLFGWFIISAEPAVSVLEAQIESVSAGAIPRKAIKLSLSAAIAAAMGLSMLRVLTGISLLWFLIPGYALALTLSFFVPDIYTAIAFDSGGVASGPMTATFMLQFVIGVSSSIGGNVLRDAFGIVALVAMLPLISIQIIGFIYGFGNNKQASEATETYGDYDIIELWGDSAA